MRLFFAADIPEEIKNSLLDSAKSLRKLNLPCKFLDKDNLHMTLLFLGDVKEESVPEIISSADAYDFHPVMVKLGKLGCFKDRRGNIKVIWRGMSEGECDLERISTFLTVSNKNILEENSLVTKPFKGHLTIGRVKISDRIVSSQIMEELKKINFSLKDESFLIDEFKLYSSTLTPEGPKYEVVKNFKFKGGV